MKVFKPFLNDRSAAIAQALSVISLVLQRNVRRCVICPVLPPFHPPICASEEPQAFRAKP